MRTMSRVDYDAIAHLYDGQPYRGKTVDPELVTFLAQHDPSGLSLLDIACGTGSQLVANRSIVPDARLVGLDRSLGMLGQAQRKGSQIAWVQAEGAMLPFRPESFDFISCQFGFHHLPDKAGMLRDVFAVLRHGGRLAMRNLCPQEHPRLGLLRVFPGGSNHRPRRFLAYRDHLGHDEVDWVHDDLGRARAHPVRAGLTGLA
jgi:ubiquinone/menaquinone biosynthesis C-methylase UbiE